MSKSLAESWFFAARPVPVQNLLDYLEGGDSLDVFLDDFPTVSRDQAMGLLGETNLHC